MPRMLLDRAAESDLVAIAAYIGIEKKSPAAARRFIADLYTKLELYAEQPELGQPGPEPNLRWFPFKKNYVVLYRPLSDGIDVLRVFHGSRDFPRWFHLE